MIYIYRERFTWPYSDVNILQIFFNFQFIQTFWQSFSVINTIVLAVKKLSYIAYMSLQYHHYIITFPVIAKMHVLKLAIVNWYMTKIVVIYLLIVFWQYTIGVLPGNSWSLQGCFETFVSKFPESSRFQWPQWTLKFRILHISGYQYQAGWNYILIWWVPLGSLIYFSGNDMTTTAINWYSPFLNEVWEIPTDLIKHINIWGTIIFFYHCACRCSSTLQC